MDLGGLVYMNWCGIFLPTNNIDMPCLYRANTHAERRTWTRVGRRTWTRVECRTWTHVEYNTWIRVEATVHC